MAVILCATCGAGFSTIFCLVDPTKGCLANAEENQETGLEFANLLGPGTVPENDEHDSGSLDSPVTEKVYRDPVSTGRKRAAKLYPLAVGQVCEWAWHKDCGGGIVQITGCTGRPASHIHHGPDKSTFNNDRDNISLICEYCHNRWHAANDKFYPEPRPADGSTWLPSLKPADECHSLSEMVKATKSEILAAEMLIPEGGKDKRV